MKVGLSSVKPGTKMPFYSDVTFTVQTVERQGNYVHITGRLSNGVVKTYKYHRMCKVEIIK